MQPTKKLLSTGTALTTLALLATAAGIVGFIWYVDGVDPNTGSLVTNATLAVVSMLSLAILAVSVFKNWEMAEAARLSAQVAADTLLEMRDVRDEETAPYVLIYFDLPYGQKFIHLVVKNAGKSVASKVTMEFDPPIQSTLEEIKNLSLLNNEIGSIPPGIEIKTLFALSTDYHAAKLPLQYRVKVSYFGGIKKDKRVSEQLLDLSPYRHRYFLTEKDMDDLVKQVEKLNYNQSNIVEALSNLTDTIKEVTNPKEPPQTAQSSGDLEAAIPSNKEPSSELAE